MSVNETNDKKNKKNQPPQAEHHQPSEEGPAITLDLASEGVDEPPARNGKQHSTPPNLPDAVLEAVNRVGRDVGEVKKNVKETKEDVGGLGERVEALAIDLRNQIHSGDDRVRSEFKAADDVLKAELIQWGEKKKEGDEAVLREMGYAGIADKVANKTPEKGIMATLGRVVDSPMRVKHAGLAVVGSLGLGTVYEFAASKLGWPRVGMFKGKPEGDVIDITPVKTTRAR